MKLTVTTAGSLLPHAAGRSGFAHTLSARIRHRLEADLLRELETVMQSERAADAADPETRRDALERAVRRIWGATL
jgi:hypothetical protein